MENKNDVKVESMDIKKALEEVHSQIEKFKNDIGKTIAAYKAGLSNGNDLTEEQKEALRQRAITNAVAEVDNLRGSLNSIEKAIKTQTKSNKDEIEKLKEENSRLNEAVKNLDGLVSEDELNKRLKDAETAYNEALAQQKKEYENLKEQYQNSSKSKIENLENQIKSLEDQLKNTNSPEDKAELEHKLEEANKALKKAGETIADYEQDLTNINIEYGKLVDLMKAKDPTYTNTATTYEEKIEAIKEMSIALAESSKTPLESGLDAVDQATSAGGVAPVAIDLEQMKQNAYFAGYNIGVRGLKEVEGEDLKIYDLYNDDFTPDEIKEAYNKGYNDGLAVNKDRTITGIGGFVGGFVVAAIVTGILVGVPLTVQRNKARTERDYAYSYIQSAAEGNGIIGKYLAGEEIDKESEEYKALINSIEAMKKNGNKNIKALGTSMEDLLTKAEIAGKNVNSLKVYLDFFYQLQNAKNEITKVNPDNLEEIIKALDEAEQTALDRYNTFSENSESAEIKIGKDGEIFVIGFGSDSVSIGSILQDAKKYNDFAEDIKNIESLKEANKAYAEFMTGLNGSVLDMITYISSDDFNGFTPEQIEALKAKAGYSEDAKKLFSEKYGENADTFGMNYDKLIDALDALSSTKLLDAANATIEDYVDMVTAIKMAVANMYVTDENGNKVVNPVYVSSSTEEGIMIYDAAPNYLKALLDLEASLKDTISQDIGSELVGIVDAIASNEAELLTAKENYELACQALEDFNKLAESGKYSKEERDALKAKYEAKVEATNERYIDAFITMVDNYPEVTTEYIKQILADAKNNENLIRALYENAYGIDSSDMTLEEVRKAVAEANNLDYTVIVPEHGNINDEANRPSKSTGNESQPGNN